MDTSSIPGLELIQVADVVAREKSIEREEVMLAMEEAIQKAGRAKYGLDRDIRAMIDRKTGTIRLERWIEVVEEVEDESMQMSLAEGAKQTPPLAVGEFWRPRSVNSQIFALSSISQSICLIGRIVWRWNP